MSHKIAAALGLLAVAGILAFGGPTKAEPVNKAMTEDLGNVDCHVFYNKTADHSLALVCELPTGLVKVPTN